MIKRDIPEQITGSAVALRAAYKVNWHIQGINPYMKIKADWKRVISIKGIIDKPPNVTFILYFVYHDSLHNTAEFWMTISVSAITSNVSSLHRGHLVTGS